MAALSIGYSFHRKHSTIQEHRKSSNPRILILLCCQSRKPVDTSNPRSKKESKRKSLLPPSFVAFEKFGKVLKENLSPKQKGDWKDVTLMSLSFAVYVYISQKIVCAYCAWMHMPKQPW
ncbi:Glycerol-3-phosphate acyltransferase [Fagus crenata]